MSKQNKAPIIQIANLKDALLEIRKPNLTLGLCHGCFDVLHFGHLIHFNEAAEATDLLFVSLTPDEFVNKGPNRPIFTVEQRAFFVSNIKCIDYVLINNSDTAKNPLDILKPNFYFKGADYLNNDSEGYKSEAKHCASLGIKLIHTKGDRFSTTETLRLMEGGIR